MDKIKQLVDEWEFERSLINKQTENKTDVNAFDTLRKISIDWNKIYNKH